MTEATVVLLGIPLSSFVTGCAIFFLREESHRLRTWLNLLGAGVKIAFVVVLLRGVFEGQTFAWSWRIGTTRQLYTHSTHIRIEHTAGAGR